MISSQLKPGCETPRTLAVFSFRYDANLVPAMLANIEPIVDGWVCYDDRSGEGVFSNEVRRRSLLLHAARDLGAHWALAIDPDERFEAPLADAMPALVSKDEPLCYTFPLREMYGERHYRVDGLWGQKRQARLLPLRHGLAAPAGELHLPWSYFIPDHQLVNTDYNLYHLKMITRARRQARAALYNHLDPERRMQPFGYDYLADDTGAQFDIVPEGKHYHPPHIEDGALWMPEVKAP